MTLTKQQRDALPADQFAVPGKRLLPLNDEKNVRMAWGTVDRVGGVSAAERTEARKRIVARAQELSIDTESWSRISALRLNAMSLNVPTDDGAHPNKMPFSGVLTRIDEPSDAPPSGSQGRLVYLTADAARDALPTLLGMAIDFTPSFDGHDTQRKVGIITDADIQGNAIVIAGFVYAADFPTVASSMKAHKDVLGFSFEMTNVFVADPAADPLVIVRCVFTGAAVLRKDKAAYTTTSLAANAADLENLTMTKEELAALLGPVIADAMKPITTRLDTLEASSQKIGEGLQAASDMKKKVAPLAKQIEAAAEACITAGIGTHKTRGHAAMLASVAADMEAQASLGTTPHAYPINGYYAARDTTEGSANDDVAKQIKDAVDAAVKPLNDKIAASETKIADLTAGGKGGNGGQLPERKTLSPAITNLLQKAGVADPNDAEGLKKLTAGALDEALKSIPDPLQRMTIKRTIERHQQGLAA